MKRHFPPQILFAIYERFLQLQTEQDVEERNIDAVVRWCKEQDWYNPEEHKISAQVVYQQVREAIAKEFLIFRPPRRGRLEHDFKEQFGLSGTVAIVDVPTKTVGRHLATTAATLIMDRIRDVHAEKAASPEKRGDGRVHLGFGAGGTARRVAHALAQELRSQRFLPPLTIHALTSGFDVKRPLDAPVAFFSYFEDITPAVDFVGLDSTPVVDCDQFDMALQQHGVKEALDEAHHIDIVITSLASGADPHGLLTAFLNLYETARASLVRRGHVGDVLMQPYGNNGPLPLKRGIRAVTLFDLAGLLDLARTDGKHVVLVAGPCERCGAHKADALRTLLTVPELRVCNHLVTDVTTAEALLRLD